MADDFGAITELGGAAALELAASALVARGAKPGKCKNCGAPVVAAYCALCGQERETHRHTLRHLAHDLAGELGSFDSRVLRTLVALLFRPGELPRAFREGQTRRYMPALRLYLFTSLVFFLVLSAADIAPLQIELKEMPNAYTVRTLPNGRVTVVSNGKVTTMPAEVAINGHDMGLSPGSHSGLVPSVHLFERIGEFHRPLSRDGWARIEELKAGILKAVGNDRNGWIARNSLATVEKLARDPAALNGYLTTWIPRMFFALLPLYAVLLTLFYWRQHRKFYFVDHLVFSLALHSFVFALLIVAVGAAQVIAGGLVAELFFAAIALYLVFAIKNFYGQGWTITTVKFAGISFIYTVFCLIPALLFIFVEGIIKG